MFVETIRPLTDEQVAELRESAFLPMYSAWTELRGKLFAAHDEIVRLKQELKDRETRIANASILMYDWDGYYNDSLKKGDPHELARLVYDSYTCLQGKGWKETKHDEQEHNGVHGAD
jgi:hypothetical protein